MPRACSVRMFMPPCVQNTRHAADAAHALYAQARQYIDHMMRRAREATLFTRRAASTLRGARCVARTASAARAYVFMLTARKAPAPIMLSCVTRYATYALRWLLHAFIRRCCHCCCCRLLLIWPNMLRAPRTRHERAMPPCLAMSPAPLFHCSFITNITFI